MFGFYTPPVLQGQRVNDDRESWRLEKDPENSYRWNIYGFRDPEYTSSFDVVASGCSQTFGQGVPEDARWSALLGEKLGLSVATVASPGWSTQRAINAVMSHIKKHGKPKIVALLIPDFFRYDSVMSMSAIKSRHSLERGDVADLTGETSGPIRDMPKVSKRPHNSEDVISTEMSYFLSGQTLRFFIEYCSAAGIRLVWGTWERSVAEIINYTSSLELDDEFKPYAPELDFSSFVDMDYYHQHRGDTSMTMGELGCHLDLKEKYEKYFDIGTDSDMHMGVHMHAHIADKFFAKLI